MIPDFSIPYNLLNSNPTFEYIKPVNVCVREDQVTYNVGLAELLKIATPIRFDKKIDFKNRIREFSKLNDNWDGYNGIKLSDKVQNNSIEFLEQLTERDLNYLDVDAITPTSYGTIVFDFENNSGLLSFEIGKNTIGYFSDFSNTKNISLESKEINNEVLLNEILPVFQKLSKSYFL